MKKIVMGIAAVAMAASMFAADIAANLRFDGDLFYYNEAHQDKNDDGSDKGTPYKKLQVLGAPGFTSEWYKAPTFALSVSTDKAGASFTVDTASTKADHQLVWFKPFDIVKVEIGAADGLALNTETIDYTQVAAGSGEYTVSLNTNGFFAGVNLKGTLVSKTGDADAAINQIYGKVSYGGDWGTVGAIGKFTGNFKDYILGAGYSGTFGGVSFFLDGYYCNTTYAGDLRNSWENFAGYVKPIIIDAFAKQSIDAFSWAAYTGVVIPDGDVAVLAKAKVSYAIGGVTPYLFVSDSNILAEDFSMTIKPGVTGNFGGMAWEVALDITVQENIKVVVPFNVAVAF